MIGDQEIQAGCIEHFEYLKHIVSSAPTRRASIAQGGGEVVGKACEAIALRQLRLADARLAKAVAARAPRRGGLELASRVAALLFDCRGTCM